MPQTALYELNPAESIFAPFHDEAIASQLPLKVVSGQAAGFRHELGWDSTKLVWDDCGNGEAAGWLEMRLDELPERFDQYVFCVVLPHMVEAQFFAERNDEWIPLGEPVTGNDTRMEIVRPLEFTPEALRMVLTARGAGTTMVSLQWWALAETELLSKLEASRPSYDASWKGLILPKEKWGQVKFTCGLLFGEEDLAALKQRAQSDLWAGHFAMMEERARASLVRNPEEEIGDFIPWSDYRYLREREQGKEPWTAEPVLCALVGLVRDDPELIRHALRYLMCFAHTTHWNQSAESNARGSVWDQRCFLEEMSVTACSLVLDWLGFALTERARELVKKAIWDKGMSVIQRDMVKWEYVYHINQGPWFCRALIFGGLVLESSWPRTRPYVEQALADLQEGMKNYLLPDGGVDEGVGYFSVTLQAVLPAVMAYARSRGKSVQELLPSQLGKSGTFVSVMSAMKPGNVLLDGDNSKEQFTGDAIALLAAIYPDDIYRKIARTTLLDSRGSNYYRQYMVDGPFSFIAGPEPLPEPSCIVPEFGQLPQTGHITSRRRLGESDEVRLHMSGCKAKASHTHFDKGAVTMELGEEPVLIDRGMVRYDDIRSLTLKRTELHNVLTPLRDDGSFLNQAWAESPVIPAGSGDAHKFEARLDLKPVWSQVMASYTRELDSPSPEQFVIHDQGELKEAYALVFNLHTRVKWEIIKEAKRAELRLGNWKLVMEAPWADSISQSEYLIDHRMEPVWHLQCRRDKATGVFELKTRFGLANQV